MNVSNEAAPVQHQTASDVEGGLTPHDIATVLARHWKSVLGAGAVGGVLAFMLGIVLPPVFSARATFLPPQQAQSSATAALASLGALAGLAGGSALRTPADQYVALMQSVTVEDRIVDKHSLRQVYDMAIRADARLKLKANSRIVAGKKDGLISVEVDDRDPGRAAAIANDYIEQLRHLTASIVITEAQQRRVFFERQMEQTRDRLVRAQQALQSSGFNQGALRAEPRAAADSYARIKAEITGTEVRLQALRGALSDSTQEVQTALATLTALRSQLARLEQAPADAAGSADYVSRYREFKYHETLFELFARQYEIARIDESREGALLQVVDPATPPEKASGPRVVRMALVGLAVGLLLQALYVVARLSWRARTRRDQ